GVVGVGDDVAFRAVADEDGAIPAEAHHRGVGALAPFIGDHDGLACLEDGDAAVARPQIDADRDLAFRHARSQEIAARKERGVYRRDPHRSTTGVCPEMQASGWCCGWTCVTIEEDSCWRKRAIARQAAGRPLGYERAGSGTGG